VSAGGGAAARQTHSLRETHVGKALPFSTLAPSFVLALLNTLAVSLRRRARASVSAGARAWRARRSCVSVGGAAWRGRRGRALLHELVAAGAQVRHLHAGLDVRQHNLQGA
jgi:hypothetical protein